MLAGSKGSVRIKQAAVVQLPSAMRGGLESLFRASQAFHPQSLKPGRLARITSLGRQSHSVPSLVLLTHDTIAMAIEQQGLMAVPFRPAYAHAL